MQLARRGEAANPPKLHIDNFAGADFDRFARVLYAVDGFIQTNRRRKLTLKFRVIHKVFPAERLLDHHQVEPVKFLQALNVAERVGRVRVGHQRNVREFFPNAFKNLRVPSRLDFYFDALVTGGGLARDFFE